MFYSMIVTVVF